MTQKQMMTPRVQEVKALMRTRSDYLAPMMRQMLQQVLEVEMEQAVGARKGEHTTSRVGYRSGHYSRTLVTRVGKIELQVPQDRDGRFSTEVFDRYQRSEKALVSALAEMYIQGVSTRKVKEITEQLCGHAFTRSVISQINKKLDAELGKFARRLLEEEYPYLVMDARYEKVRIDGVIRTQAVLVALGITWEGRREVLAVELANRESAGSWEQFILLLKQRGLRGVQYVVSDQHEGLKSAIGKLLPEACWQRCYVHFLRNALDHLPRKVQDDCLTELKWLYDRRDLAEAHRDLQGWLARGRATLSLRLPQDEYLCAALAGQSGPGARACLSRQKSISAKLAMVGRDDPLVRRFIQINPALRLVEDAALADAVIAIAALPPGDKPALVIDPPQPPPGYRPGEKLTNLPLRQADLQADSPLLRYVDLAAVAVRQSRGWREGDLASGQKIVSYQGQVLVLAQDAPRRLYVAFDFDPENTNFGLTDSFVAFLANATGWLLPQARRQVSYSALRPDQAQFGQAPSDWQELLFAQGHSAAEAAGEAPAASEISRSGMPERHSDAASPLPWPGVYRDRSGALQAVSLTGLRSANPPRDPAELAANAPLPAPQQIGARQELWPAFLIAAALLWLAGWTVRLR